MKLYALVVLFMFSSVGLLGCPDDTGPGWDDFDSGWNDIEDVGDQKDSSSGPGDVANPGDKDVDDVEPAVPASGRSWVLGTTWDGRPIVAEEFGSSGPILYIMAAIHGNERPAVTFGERLRVPLQGGLADRAGVRVFYLGAANPDGIADNTRYNSMGIDLNRNFPSDNFDPGGWGGFEPLSEPESVVIHDSVVAIDPAAVISIHCCIPVIDWDGPGESLASRMATAAGFPASRLGSLPGSFGSFSGTDMQIPTITVEFAVHEEIDTSEQLDHVDEAIVVAMDWVVEEEISAQGYSIYDVLLPKSSNVYSAIDLGKSAGNLTIRGERIGEAATKKVLVVAGIDASERHTLYVAEHIRSSLLSDQPGSYAQITVVTAANPDGIFKQSSRNADDQDVVVDFGLEPAKTPEARALRALIAAGGFSMVIFVDADANGDRIESFGVPAAEIESMVGNSLDVVDGDVESQAEHSFIRYLSGLNVPVLRFAVTTKFAVGTSYEGHEFEDITVFSQAVRRLTN